MRWDSPPERVPLLRSRVRYPRPTLLRNSRRSRTSLMRLLPMSWCSGGRVKVARVWRESSTGSWVKSWMPRLLILTWRISGLRRWPSQVLQCWEVRYFPMLRLTPSDSVSRLRRSTVLQRPS